MWPSFTSNSVTWSCSADAETVASSVWLHGGFNYEVSIPTAHCVNASRQLPLRSRSKERMTPLVFRRSKEISLLCVPFKSKRKTFLLINPEATIQWYHSKISPKIFAPDLGRSQSLNTTGEIPSSTTVGVLNHPRLIRLPTHGHFRSHPRITCTLIQPQDGKVRIGLPRNGRGQLTN
jgi:hypothetical protein